MLNQFLENNLNKLQSHWQNTHGKGHLANALLLAASDGEKRAKVKTLWIDVSDFQAAGLQTLKVIQDKLAWMQKEVFDAPIKWVRIEWASNEQLMSWRDFNEELKRYKRNYFRSGVAFKGVREDWLPVTEMELNAHACLYAGNTVPVAQVNQENLQKCLKARHGSSQMPDFKPDMSVLVFQAAGLFFDVEQQEIHLLETLPRQQGRRTLLPLDADFTAGLIKKVSDYLARQVQDNGRYEYGHFPVFGRTIDTYNTLRHASSTYALVEGYEFCRAHVQDEKTLAFLSKQIDLALRYLIENIIRHYPDGRAYVVEEGNEIKLGANAVAILALVKYLQVFEDTVYRDEFLNLAEALAEGIAAMQRENGSFVHILDADTLQVLAENRVIYYDGEAAFGLMRLYGLTQNPRWLAIVTKAFDYFIGAGHNGAHDHWLSYCSNELVIYQPERKYFQFAVNNVKGYTHFIHNRITTFPTLLELSMAFHKMLLKLDEFPQFYDVLDGFDVEGFYQALHARANYLTNGFFFPEMAMFFKKPDSVVNGCFIRHHAFRVRIDDVEHYLSGWIAYHELLRTQRYPKTVDLIDLSMIEKGLFHAGSLPVATQGKWVVAPDENWQATGLCIYPKSFQAGQLVVARGKGMEKGYLPKIAVKSLVLKGAAGIICDSPEEYADFGVPVLKVGNVRKAVLDLGHFARRYFQGKVVGVTGSAGKTTTVAMLTQTLQTFGGAEQTLGSANLPIGIAWNMASLKHNVPFWVLEMAIGNMALNSELVQPDVAVITNIAPAHLEYHNNVDMIAIKKARIFDSMKAGGLAVICRDIEQYGLIKEKAEQRGLRVISYGEHQDADARLSDYQGGKAKIKIQGQVYTLNLKTQGKHIALNALAVLVVADEMKLDLKSAIVKLNEFEAVSGRGAIHKAEVGSKEITVYDEAYNANPLSMQAALTAFAELDYHPENKLLIVGDMLELGQDEARYHLEMAQQLAQMNVREILLVGKLSVDAADYLQQQGKVCRHFDDVHQLKKVLHEIVRQDDAVLIKASHGIGLGTLFG